MCWEDLLWDPSAFLPSLSSTWIENRNKSWGPHGWTEWNCGHPVGLVKAESSLLRSRGAGPPHSPGDSAVLTFPGAEDTCPPSTHTTRAAVWDIALNTCPQAPNTFKFYCWSPASDLLIGTVHKVQSQSPPLPLPSPSPSCRPPSMSSELILGLDL